MEETFEYEDKKEMKIVNSNKFRKKIYHFLKENPKWWNANSISRELGISYYTVTRHCYMLSDNNYFDKDTIPYGQGTMTLWRINDGTE